MYIFLHVSGLLFLSDFNHSRNVLTEFSFNSVYVTKIRTLGTEFFHADGGTDRRIDMMKPVVTFHNYLARAPKKFKKFKFSLKLKVPVSNLGQIRANVCVCVCVWGGWGGWVWGL
jgi:hypothetical protein